MTKLEQHHVRYLEIQGEDEIVMLTRSEHKKVHLEDRANGFKPIPKWIVDAAHMRSHGRKLYAKGHEQSEERKETYKKYNQSEKGKAASRASSARHRTKQKLLKWRLHNESKSIVPRDGLQRQ